MDDIYTILAKYFSKSSTPEEDLQINQFRKNNPTEYKMLYKLWQKGEIEIHDFNTEEAWKRFLKKSNKPARVIPLYNKFWKTAVAVTILVITSFSIYFLTSELSKTKQIVTENIIDKPLDIELADGSVIWLKKGAALSYADKFRGGRKVTLSGTAFFNIAKDNEHPFIILTANSKVTVRGTSFNIYSKPDKTEVSVRSGTVEVQSLENNEKVIIKQNQTAIVSKDKLIHTETTNPNYLAWQNGVFEFNNTSIVQVVKDLNTYYLNRVELDTTKFYDCNLTAKFNKTNLEEILLIIETTCDLSINKIDNTYKIH